MNKHDLRLRLLRAREQLSESQRHFYSRQIISSLRALLHHHHIREVLAYHSIGAEVETAALHRQPADIPVYAPVCMADSRMIWRSSAHARWTISSHRTPEPVDGKVWRPQAGRRCAVVCPLLGFDRQGNRLGMGAGYFDRWLAEYHHHLVFSIGLAFACQEVEQLPVELHDHPLDMIITEKETIACQNISISSPSAM